MGSYAFFRAGLAAFTLSMMLTGSPEAASASGPVERIVQVLRHPTDPKVVVLRYGVASEGLLFSRDGGRSFAAMCNDAITPDISRARGPAAYKAPVVFDGQGQLVFNTFEAIFVGDGSGCAWTQDQGLDGKKLTSIQTDPRTGEVLVTANVASGDEIDDLVVRAELLRRSADGTWTVAGLLKAPGPNMRTYGGDLQAVATETGTQLYATITSYTGPIEALPNVAIVTSRDGGKTWSELAVTAEQQDLALQAVDPREPSHLLASISRGDGPDQLLYSDDGAKTFRDYGSVHQLSGVTFAPDGRVFVGDAGDSAAFNAPGGVFTAARLGQPLTKVPAASELDVTDVDCVGFDGDTQKLNVCKLNRYGELDWSTGVFTELTQLEKVEKLLECPGKSIKDICEKQLNAGPAWCCTLHYPFTPFCGEYDVQQAGGRRVSCGLSGRAADIAAGRGPLPPDGDNATPPSGAPSDASGGSLMSTYGDYTPPARSAAASEAASDGCALGGSSARADSLAYALLGVCGLLFGRAFRRRRGVRR